MVKKVLHFVFHSAVQRAYFWGLLVPVITGQTSFPTSANIKAPKRTKCQYRLCSIKSGPIVFFL